MRDTLLRLFEHQKLTYEEAKKIMKEVAQGQHNPSHVAAFVTTYLMRPITVDELRGFQDALLELCVAVDLEGIDSIDICGTGGDGKNTYNVSTTASFIVAAAGYKVSKHGNYGVSSKCGSSNVLEYLGYQFKPDLDKLKRELDATNLMFMHAPFFHPAMKNVAKFRRELRIKTFFNMLGPLVNPAKPTHQFTGVYSLGLARLYHYIQTANQRQYIVVHSTDGYDEISLTGAVKIYSNGWEQLLTPLDLGLPRVKAASISGGETIEESADILVGVLKGEGTASQTAVALANAAMAIQCFDQEKPYSSCLGEAREAIDSGKAFQTFEKMIAMQ